MLRAHEAASHRQYAVGATLAAQAIRLSPSRASAVVIRGLGVAVADLPGIRRVTGKRY
jgi:hypothetical protein